MCCDLHVEAVQHRNCHQEAESISLGLFLLQIIMKIAAGNGVSRILVGRCCLFLVMVQNGLQQKYLFQKNLEPY
jgi:hypothetical protein